MDSDQKTSDGLAPQTFWLDCRLKSFKNVKNGSGH